MLQICGTIVVCFTFLSLGAVVGYPTQALPQLKSDKDEAIRLNENEASSFATVLWITGIICAPLGGVLSGIFGRKKFLMLTTPLGNQIYLVTLRPRQLTQASFLQKMKRCKMFF